MSGAEEAPRSRFDQFVHDATNHPPANDSVVEALELCRDGFIDAAAIACREVPPGRELSLALTKLEEGLMWARAGIARNQGAVPYPRVD